jgi:hypothetical protein
MAQKCSQAPQKKKKKKIKKKKEEEEEEKQEVQEKQEVEEKEEEKEEKEEDEKYEENPLPYYKTGAKSKHISQLVPPILVSYVLLTSNFWQQQQYIKSKNV